MFKKNVENINIIAKTFYLLLLLPSLIPFPIIIYLFIIFRLEHEFIHSYMAFLIIMYDIMLIATLIYYIIKTGYLNIDSLDYIQFPMAYVKNNYKDKKGKYIKNYRVFYKDVTFSRIDLGAVNIHLKNLKSARVPLVYIPDQFFTHRIIKNKKIIGDRYSLFNVFCHTVVGLSLPIGKVIFFFFNNDRYRGGLKKIGS